MTVQPSLLPPIMRALGYAGLLPQLFAVAALLTGGLAWRFTALALAFAYAALILSFLGGLWWGLAAREPQRAPPWVWVAGVTPSLVALATTVPWMVGGEWPGPSLLVLGVAILGTLAIDRALDRRGLCPPGWVRLRTYLSLGLGALTVAAGLL
jgi:hypothetical protein